MIMVKWFNLVISLQIAAFFVAHATLFSHAIRLKIAQHQTAKQNSDFIVKPYLQLGLEEKSDASTATVVWFTSNDTHKWSVLVQAVNSSGKAGKAAKAAKTAKTTIESERPADSILERLSRATRLLFAN
jgi:hypothetical protein